MRKPARPVLTALAVAGLAASTLAAGAVHAASTGAREQAAHRPDNRPGPFTKRQDARRKAAQELILSGQAAPGPDGVVALDEDKYFQAAIVGEGQVFTILAEFGDQSLGKLGRVPGPVHNEIPKPNRDIVDGA